MNRFACLLRGINVGGANKLSMTGLRDALQQNGLVNVVTYINSGNVVFDSNSTSPQELSMLIEAVILEHFSLSIPTLVISCSTFQRIAAAIPETWENNSEQKSDIFFLWPPYDTQQALLELPLVQGIDSAHYVPGAILWNVARIYQGRSGMNAVIGTPFYKHCTIRNCNTVRKLARLLL